MKLARIVVPAVLAALLGVSCGGSSPTTGSTPTSPAPSATETTESPSPTGGTTQSTLTMVDNEFKPADFTIAAGQQITLMNDGAALHNFSVEGQDIDKDVNPGETEMEDLELPAGTYTMFCKYHRSLGMEGTLTITG